MGYLKDLLNRHKIKRTGNLFKDFYSQMGASSGLLADALRDIGRQGVAGSQGVLGGGLELLRTSDKNKAKSYAQKAYKSSLNSPMAAGIGEALGAIPSGLTLGLLGSKSGTSKKDYKTKGERLVGTVGNIGGTVVSSLPTLGAAGQMTNAGIKSTLMGKALGFSEKNASKIANIASTPALFAVLGQARPYQEGESRGKNLITDLVTGSLFHWAGSGAKPIQRGVSTAGIVGASKLGQAYIAQKKGADIDWEEKGVEAATDALMWGVLASRAPQYAKTKALKEIGVRESNETVRLYDAIKDANLDPSKPINSIKIEARNNIRNFKGSDPEYQKYQRVLSEIINAKKETLGNITKLQGAEKTIDPTVKEDIVNAAKKAKESIAKKTEDIRSNLSKISSAFKPMDLAKQTSEAQGSITSEPKIVDPTQPAKTLSRVGEYKEEYKNYLKENAGKDIIPRTTQLLPTDKGFAKVFSKDPSEMIIEFQRVKTPSPTSGVDGFSYQGIIKDKNTGETLATTYLPDPDIKRANLDKTKVPSFTVDVLGKPLTKNGRGFFIEYDKTTVPRFPGGIEGVKPTGEGKAVPDIVDEYSTIKDIEEDFNYKSSYLGIKEANEAAQAIQNAVENGIDKTQIEDPGISDEWKAAYKAGEDVSNIPLTKSEEKRRNEILRRIVKGEPEITPEEEKSAIIADKVIDNAVQATQAPVKPEAPKGVVSAPKQDLEPPFESNPLRKKDTTNVGEQKQPVKEFTKEPPVVNVNNIEAIQKEPKIASPDVMRKILKIDAKNVNKTIASLSDAELKEFKDEPGLSEIARLKMNEAYEERGLKEEPPIEITKTKSESIKRPKVKESRIISKALDELEVEREKNILKADDEANTSRPVKVIRNESYVRLKQPTEDKTRNLNTKNVKEINKLKQKGWIIIKETPGREVNLSDQSRTTNPDTFFGKREIDPDRLIRIENVLIDSDVKNVDKAIEDIKVRYDNGDDLVSILQDYKLSDEEISDALGDGRYEHSDNALELVRPIKSKYRRDIDALGKNFDPTSKEFKDRAVSIRKNAEEDIKKALSLASILQEKPMYLGDPDIKAFVEGQGTREGEGVSTSTEISDTLNKFTTIMERTGSSKEAVDKVAKYIIDNPQQLIDNKKTIIGPVEFPDKEKSLGLAKYKHNISSWFKDFTFQNPRLELSTSKDRIYFAKYFEPLTGFYPENVFAAKNLANTRMRALLALGNNTINNVYLGKNGTPRAMVGKIKELQNKNKKPIEKQSIIQVDLGSKSKMSLKEIDEVLDGIIKDGTIPGLIFKVDYYPYKVFNQHMTKDPITGKDMSLMEKFNKVLNSGAMVTGEKNSPRKTSDAYDDLLSDFNYKVSKNIASVITANSRTQDRTAAIRPIRATLAVKESKDPFVFIDKAVAAYGMEALNKGLTIPSQSPMFGVSRGRLNGRKIRIFIIGKGEIEKKDIYERNLANLKKVFGEDSVVVVDGRFSKKDIARLQHKLSDYNIYVAIKAGETSDPFVDKHFYDLDYAAARRLNDTVKKPKDERLLTKEENKKKKKDEEAKLYGDSLIQEYIDKNKIKESKIIKDVPSKSDEPRLFSEMSQKEQKRALTNLMIKKLGKDTSRYNKDDAKSLVSWFNEKANSNFTLKEILENIGKEAVNKIKFAPLDISKKNKITFLTKEKDIKVEGRYKPPEWVDGLIKTAPKEKVALEPPPSFDQEITSEIENIFNENAGQTEGSKKRFTKNDIGAASVLVGLLTSLLSNMLKKEEKKG